MSEGVNLGLIEVPACVAGEIEDFGTLVTHEHLTPQQDEQFIEQEKLFPLKVQLVKRLFSHKATGITPVN